MLLAAQEYGCLRPIALIAALTQGRDLLARRQGKQIDDARDDLFGDEAESDFFVLMRAWRYAERNGYQSTVAVDMVFTPQPRVRSDRYSSSF